MSQVTADPIRMTPTAHALIAGAQARGWRVEPLGWRGGVIVHAGGHSARLFGSITDRTSHLAMQLAGDKAATKARLRAVGVATPDGGLVADEAAAVGAWRRLAGPVAIKPNLGAQGRAVRTGLADEESVRSAYRRANGVAGAVLAERHHEGRDLRLLMVDGRLAAAAERQPAYVEGDGESTLAQLLLRLNADARRPADGRGPMKALETDDCLIDHLSRQGLSLADAPAMGRKIGLRSVASISRGGRAIDVTDRLHPDFAVLGARAAEAVGLDVSGVDVIAPDLTDLARAVVIEVNASPGLRMHLSPDEGAPRDVAGAILDYLLPTITGVEAPRRRRA